MFDTHVPPGKNAFGGASEEVEGRIVVIGVEKFILASGFGAL